MNPKARAVAFLLVIFGLVASWAPGNLSSHSRLTAFKDGSQPPVPPKFALLDGSQPPVPPKMAPAGVRLDGSQPPVPPKAAAAVAWMLDGSQPPVPPKALAAAA